MAIEDERHIAWNRYLHNLTAPQTAFVDMTLRDKGNSRRMRLDVVGAGSLSNPHLADYMKELDKRNLRNDSWN